MTVTVKKGQAMTMLKNPTVHLLCAYAVALLLTACGETKGTEGISENHPAKNGKSTEGDVLVTKAELKKLKNEIEVPGELVAFQDVAIHAKVEGFISWIGVDRGSWVKKGQKMIEISCPELMQKVDEADAKLSAAESVALRAKSALQTEKAKVQQDQAKLEADELTYKRLLEASRTPGAIAQNEVDLAAKTVEGDQGRVAAGKASIAAAEAVVVAEEKNVMAARRVVDSLLAMRSYLTIHAPFDGVVSSRNVHEGSIVAVDGSRNANPLVRVQQVDKLRLVAAIPEDAVGNLHKGDKIPFTVPAYPGKTLYGVVARPAFALDPATRTMPVELNVDNSNHELDPGMFCTVQWVVSRPYETVFLPSSAIGTDLVGSFVNKVRDGILSRVPVKKGDSMGATVEVIGDVKAGDQVLLKASNEITDGSRIESRIATADETQKANAKREKVGGE